MASNTKKMRLGTCVTNPATRDITVTSSLFATLNLISGGRMQLGIGRGDSSRRVLGKKPVGAGDLERAVKTFRELTAAQEIEYDGQPTRISWATGSPPVWIAGYGPKVLDLAGRVGDGVILQFADPDLIAWCLGFVKKGAEAAGRDFRKIEVMAAAPVWVSDDLKVARERVRWFPALVSNHVVDLISRYKPGGSAACVDIVCAQPGRVRLSGSIAKSRAATRNSCRMKWWIAFVWLGRPWRIGKNFVNWPALGLRSSTFI